MSPKSRQNINSDSIEESKGPGKPWRYEKPEKSGKLESLLEKFRAFQSRISSDGELLMADVSKYINWSEFETVNDKNS